jgi:hypothetical protein
MSLSHRVSFIALFGASIIVALVTFKLGREDSEFAVKDKENYFLVDEQKAMDDGQDPELKEPDEPSFRQQPDDVDQLERAMFSGSVHADLHQISKWSETRGYISKEDKAIYSSYSRESLVQMAEGGDIAAMQTLSVMALSEGNSPAAFGYLQQAAARGSTYALAAIGTIKTAGLHLEEDSETRRSLALEGLAWYEAAVLRGDPAMTSYIESFKSEHGIELAPDEVMLVKQNAASIYEVLADRREALGLDEFDNSDAIKPEHK